MKKIYLFIAILFVQITVFAQEGVNFRDLTFTEALEAAKKEQTRVHGLLHRVVRTMQEHGE